MQYQWGTSGLLIFACSWLPPVPGTKTTTKTTTTINNAPCESNIYLWTHLLIQFIVMNILGVFSRHLLQVTTPKINHFDFLQSLENDHFYHASKPSHFSNNGRFTDPFLKRTILMWLYTRFLYVFGVLLQNRPFSSIFPFAKWPFLSPSQNLVHFFNTKRPVNSLLRGSFWHVT